MVNIKTISKQTSFRLETEKKELSFLVVGTSRAEGTRRTSGVPPTSWYTSTKKWRLKSWVEDQREVGPLFLGTFDIYFVCLFLFWRFSFTLYAWNPVKIDSLLRYDLQHPAKWCWSCHSWWTITRNEQLTWSSTEYVSSPSSYSLKNRLCHLWKEKQTTFSNYRQRKRRRKKQLQPPISSWIETGAASRQLDFTVPPKWNAIFFRQTCASNCDSWLTTVKSNAGRRSTPNGT